ncbi:hypothetical protein N0V86_000721 [Didymella sp. IMI 355093]|nr:hypothetical protein N0V86_000721 [Didymella sp. IMI 355093]
MSVTENPHAASTSTVSQPPYQGATSDSVPKFPDHMNPAHTPTRLSKLVEETKLLPVTTEIEEDEQDEFDENKGVAQPTTNQLPDPPPIYPPPRPERLTMELPKPPVAHEDVIVNGHSISDEEMGFADGVLDAHSALRYRRVDGTQRQRDLPSSEKLSTTNQPIYLGRDGEEPARVKAQSEDAEALRRLAARLVSAKRSYVAQAIIERYERCGQQFFGDVKEYRADGVKELIEKMSPLDPQSPIMATKTHQEFQYRSEKRLGIYRMLATTQYPQSVFAFNIVNISTESHSAYKT